MTTFNTGNPIGSTDARDRSDNSEFLDEVVNSLDLTRVDRLGRTRDTLEGIYQKSAYYRAGTFDAGYTLTNNRQTLAHGNVEYSWSGAFPKVVAAGSTPSTSGGIGAGAWVDRTDVTLRGELSSEGGVDLVNGALKGSDVGLKPIHKFSTYNPADIYSAWLYSINTYGYVYLSGGDTTQYTLNGTHPDLYSSVVISDPDVTLIVSDDQYPLLGSLKIKGDLKIKTASINTSIQSSKIDKVSSVAKIKHNLLHSSVINFNDCYASTVSGDTFSSVAKGSSSSSAIVIPLTESQTTGLFVPIAIGEEISAHLRVESGSVNSLGIMLRCANGWVKVSGVVNSTDFNVSYKVMSNSEVSNGVYNNINSGLESYASGKASIGVSIVASDEFYFLLNGTSSTTLYSNVGDIIDVGFIFEGAASSSTGRITGLCCYKSDKSAYGYGPLNIAIYGDSTADEYAGSFDKYLPQLLDGENASRSLSIENYAIAGQSFQQQFDLLRANGPGQAYIICMVAGTNDIQGGMKADTFVTKVNSFIDYCVERGRKPMLVEPWLWYPQSMIGAGQPSSHYQDGAELREAGKRVALSRGAIYVSTTHELPAPVPSYFNSGNDPLLRDDIHQSQLGYRLYAELIASHIIEFMGRITKKGISIPNLWKTSIVSSIVSSSVNETGFSGSFQVSGFSNGAVVLNLPRWCRPPRPITVPAVFTTSLGALASARAVVNANGTVTVDGLTTYSSTIVISAQW